MKLGLCARHILCGLILAAPGLARAQAVKPLVRVFQNPTALTVHKGQVVVANSLSDSISSVQPQTNWVTLLASGLRSPQAVCYDSAGNLYVANGADGSITRIAPSGAQSQFATGFSRPQALVFDPAGNLDVADQVAGTISKITPAGVVSVFARGLAMPSALTIDTQGNLYAATALDGTVARITPSGAVSVFANGLLEPYGLAIDGAGRIYVAELAGARITRLSATGAASIFVSAATLAAQPLGLAFDGGALYVGTLAGNVLRISSAGTVTTKAPMLPGVGKGLIARDAAGDIFLNPMNEVIEIPAGKPRRFITGFAGINLTDLVADAGGDAYGLWGGAIYERTPDGQLIQLPGEYPNASRLAIGGAGSVYVETPATSSTTTGTITKITPSGQVSNFATITGLTGSILAGKAGVIYAETITDPNANFVTTSTLVAITPGGGVSPIALTGCSGGCNGLALGVDGNIYGSGVNISVPDLITPVSTPILFAVGAAGVVTPINGVNPGGGRLVAANADGAVELITFTADNAVSAIYPASPANPPSYHLTAADAQQVSVFGSLMNYSWLETPPPQIDQLVLNCAANVQSLLTAYYVNCVTSSPAASLFTANGAAGVLAQFRTDIGLDYSGALPSAGYVQGASGFGIARFQTTAPGGALGLLQHPN